MRQLRGLSKRLSGPRPQGDVSWAKGDATRNCVARVNWANNNLPELAPRNILRGPPIANNAVFYFRMRASGVDIISLVFGWEESDFEDNPQCVGQFRRRQMD